MTWEVGHLTLVCDIVFEICISHFNDLIWPKCIFNEDVLNERQ